jgi:D-lactate dehydrogenase (cytochrome)
MARMSRPDAVPPAAIEALKEILGPGGWLDAPADRAPYETDFRRLYRGRTPLVALPDSTARVAALLAFCHRERIAVVPQGGNTSYCGGAAPGPAGDEIVVSLRRMRGIRAVDALNDSLTAEAGCVLADLQSAAAGAGRLLPMSIGSEGSATLGGIVSTNAGGTAVLRYGMMRALVLGLEAVLPDGRVLDQLSALRKDNTGYDVKQLFIGAEGTLGIVTAATLRLFPRPAGTATAFVALAAPADALALLARLRAAVGDAVATFEILPRLALEFVTRHVPGARDPFGAPHAWYVLAEATHSEGGPALEERFQSALAAALEAGIAQDAAVAASEADRDAFWRLRETIPEAQGQEGASLKHDISVEPARLPAFIEAGSALLGRLAPGARLVAYGHLGDGNLHFNLSEPAGGDGGALAARTAEIRRAVHDLVAGHGGSFSAEHGIGQSKVGELERYEDPAALDLMRAIKQAIDPRGIMNPGKVLRAQPPAAEPGRRSRRKA